MQYNSDMASLLIKNVPPELHARLQETARRNHRSMTKQVIAILEVALGQEPTELPPLLKGAFPLDQDWLDRAIADGRS
jgi:plasmid stability protein